MKKNNKIIIGVIAAVVVVACCVGYAVYAVGYNNGEKLAEEQTKISKEIGKTDSSKYYEEDRAAIDKLIEDAKADIKKTKKISEIDKIKADFEKALEKYDTMSAYTKKINKGISEYLDKENYYEPEQTDIDAIVKKYEDAIKTSTKKSDVKDLEKNAKDDLDLILTKEEKDIKVEDGEIESTKASTSNTSTAKGSSSSINKPSGGSSSSSSGSSTTAKKKVWVVDRAAWTETKYRTETDTITVYRCSHGIEFSSYSAAYAHYSAGLDSGDICNFGAVTKTISRQVPYTVSHPATGHYEYR